MIEKTTKTNDQPSANINKTEASTSGTERLGQVLIRKGLVTSDQIQVALTQQRQTTGDKKMIGTILVELGFITESLLGEVLNEVSGVKNIDLSKIMFDSKIINILPKDIALKFKIIPLSVDESKVVVATNDTYNIVALDNVRKYFPKNLHIEAVYASEGSILDVIDKYYQYDMSIDSIIREIELSILEKRDLNPTQSGYVNPVVRLVDAIIIEATKMNSSDIHFEPEDHYLRIRYRIDGILRQVRSFHRDYWAAVCTRLKIIAGMNIAESRMPQDGRISYSMLGRDIDLRVATHPTIHGENIVIRILDKKSSVVEFKTLGYSQENSTIINKILKKPEGIIIIAGPTGSGKTTSLYSMLALQNDTSKNIMTLEEPVEYQIPLIRQTNIRETNGLSFADGVRSILRQDPDIMFIGEMRDETSAKMAIRASITGHQVFTTLHANDAISAIPRLLEMNVDPGVAASSILCIISQRLVRKLCAHCKITFTPDQQILDLFKKTFNKDIFRNDNTILYQHKGCDQCYNTGYNGRIAICEILRFDLNIQDLVSSKASRKTILEYSLENGFKPISYDALLKVLEGLTDLEEISRVVDIL